MNASLVLKLALVIPALGSAAIAADSAAPDYAKHIAPLLRKYCAGCHDDLVREGEFSLESYASLQKGTPKGPAILPGDPDNSRLVRVLTGAAEPVMPPEGEPRPSDEEIALLKAWIAAGAKGPEGAEPDRLALVVPKIESHVDVRPIAAIDLSRDGRWLAVARYAEVSLHAVRADGSIVLDPPQRVLKGFPGKVTAVHFTPDGSRLVTASGVAGLGGIAAIWNTADGSLVREFKGHRDILYDAELSPDGKVLATCSYDKTIELWNAETGEPLRTLAGHNGAVYDVAFSPDGRFLVSASADDTCKVWRVEDGGRMDTLGQPLKEAYACAFTPDGEHIVAAGADNNIRVWRFLSHDRPRINPMVIARFAHEAPVVRLAFTPDGSKLVSIAEDRTIKVWNASDYTERQLWENQPEVASAVAVAADGRSFLVGRLDGSLQAFTIDQTSEKPREAAPQVADAVPMDDMGAPKNATEQEPNNTPAQATKVEAPVRITGVIDGEAEGRPDFDLYRFTAKAGQEWVIEVDAARSKSPLDSFVEVLDGEGNRIERVLLQAVRDSYFTFRGKDGDTSGDFRVFNWEEMRLNEYLYASGEVVKLWLYPRGPDSGFMVYPGQGKRWGYFDTTPLAHALGEPCYIVRAHPPGTPLIPNGLPVFTIYYENDDDAHRELGKDSRLFFTAPADGEYLVKIKDVRGEQGPEFKYTLAIRPRRPDLKVTLHGADPTVNAGSAKEFKVTAQRIDGFEGPIRVDIEGLPPGFSATTPVVIEEGQIEAFGVIVADPDAPAPTPENAKGTKVTATASIRGETSPQSGATLRVAQHDAERRATITHEVNNLGEIKLAEKPKLLIAVAPVEGGATPVAAPADGPLEFEIAPGETIKLKVRVERNGYGGQVPFGNEGSGRNLPFGSYIDNLGLNGLLILEDQTEREFFITADKSVPEQSRLFHLKTDVEGGQASRPVLLHVRRKETVAGR